MRRVPALKINAMGSRRPALIARGLIVFAVMSVNDSSRGASSDGPGVGAGGCAHLVVESRERCSFRIRICAKGCLHLRPGLIAVNMRQQSLYTRYQLLAVE